MQQRQIIDRVASRSVLTENREAFRKYVSDILRGKKEPTNTDVRHVFAGIIKYGRKL